MFEMLIFHLRYLNCTIQLLIFNFIIASMDLKDAKSWGYFVKLAP